MRFVPDTDGEAVQLSPAVASRLLRLLAQGDQRPVATSLAGATTLPASTGKPRRWGR